RDLAETFELEERPRHACNSVADEQKDRLLGRAVADVRDFDACLDRVVLAHLRRAHPKIGELEASVREAVTERKLRRIRLVEIPAGEMVVGCPGPAGRPRGEEDRDLAYRTRPGYRRPAARRDASRPHVGERVTRLAPEEPRREHGVRLLDQPWHDQW